MTMAKCVFSPPYGEIVLDAKDAMALMEIFSKVERYQSKWHSATNDKESHTTYHIYEFDSGGSMSLKLLTDAEYRNYKLAGKPEEK
jgi:hypothetical protein